MKKKNHSESEMVRAVKELESGVDAETVARNYNVSRATLYNWKKVSRCLEQILKNLEG